MPGGEYKRLKELVNRENTISYTTVQMLKWYGQVEGKSPKWIIRKVHTKLYFGKRCTGICTEIHCRIVIKGEEME